MIKQFFGTGAIAASVACATLAGCTSLRVTSDVNTPLVSTVQCHTFSWAGSFRGGSDNHEGPANKGPVAFAYPCAMETAISSCVQRMISGLFAP